MPDDDVHMDDMYDALSAEVDRLMAESAQAENEAASSAMMEADENPFGHSNTLDDDDKMCVE